MCACIIKGENKSPPYSNKKVLPYSNIYLVGLNPNNLGKHKEENSWYLNVIVFIENDKSFQSDIPTNTNYSLSCFVSVFVNVVNYNSCSICLLNVLI